MSCNRCKQKKMKCDNREPCSLCTTTVSECEYVRRGKSGKRQDRQLKILIPSRLDGRDQDLLTNYSQNVVRTVFTLLDEKKLQLFIPSLVSNKAYLHCCLGISAIHLKAMHKGSCEQSFGDIIRHRRLAIEELRKTVQKSESMQIFETTLTLIVLQAFVGNPGDSLLALPWHSHFQAAASLAHQIDRSLPSFRRPVYIALLTWIDILGATLLGRPPKFAATYRAKLQNNEPSGLLELMGCDDRVMYLISETASLESAQLDRTNFLAQYNILNDWVTKLDPSITGPFVTVDHLTEGKINAEQTRRSITLVFWIALRVHLNSLSNFDRSEEIALGWVDDVSTVIERIPGGPTGFDNAIAWPYMVVGTISTPNSRFREVFARRVEHLGDQSQNGTFGRAKAILEEVWRTDDVAYKKGFTHGTHWRHAMKQNGWDMLVL